jgi:hypothetical protein
MASDSIGFEFRAIMKENEISSPNGFGGIAPGQFKILSLLTCLEEKTFL